MEKHGRWSGNCGGWLRVPPRSWAVLPVLVLLFLLGVVFWSEGAPADASVSGSGMQEGAPLTERIALLEESLAARNEGERLEALGVLREALVLYERSLALFADPALAAGSPPSGSGSARRRQDSRDRRSRIRSARLA